MVAELKLVCAEQKCQIKNFFEEVKEVDVVAAVKQHIKTLMYLGQLNHLSNTVKHKYKEIFELIPHLDELPTDIYCHIKVKDATQQITTRSYNTPCKYKEAWATLIQQHLDVGRIWLSNSAHTSPAFLVPKWDPKVLPGWVNDF